MRLGEIATSLKNGIYKSDEFYGRGVPCLRMYNIQERRIVLKDITYIDVTPAELEIFGLLEGDILINRVNSAELVGKAALIPPNLGDCVFESKNIRVRVDQDRVLPAYIVYVLDTQETKREITLKGKRAIGQVTINQDDLAELLLPLPPLSVQQNIASSLDKDIAVVMKMRAAAERQQGAVTVITSVLLREMFEGEVAQQWERTKIGEVCSVHPGQHILEADYNHDGNGIGYLTGPADFGETYPTITKWTEKPKAWSMPGDVLVTVKGAGVGKTNLAPKERVAIGRQLMAVRPDTKIVDQIFLHRVINTHFLWLQSKATGATVPGLAREDIESLELPLPPLSVQQNFALKLNTQTSTVVKVQAEVGRQLDAINALPSAILREVFGEFVSP